MKFIEKCEDTMRAQALIHNQGMGALFLLGEFKELSCRKKVLQVDHTAADNLVKNLEYSEYSEG